MKHKYTKRNRKVNLKWKEVFAYSKNYTFLINMHCINHKLDLAEVLINNSQKKHYNSKKVEEHFRNAW